MHMKRRLERECLQIKCERWKFLSKVKWKYDRPILSHYELANEPPRRGG